MGESTFKGDRVLLDYPRDCAELADALDIGPFGVLGWSGGGAHTVVCAYALAKRLTFCLALCGYTNFAELPGAGELLESSADRLAVRLAEKSPWLFWLMFELIRPVIRLAPGLLIKELIRSVNDMDKAIVSESDFTTLFIRDQQVSFRQGGRGNYVDAVLHFEDWGFRLSEIPGKVHIFHGTEDRLVPFAYAQHLADNIPNAQLHALEGQGHLFPVDNQDLIFSTARAELA